MSRGRDVVHKYKVFVNVEETRSKGLKVEKSQNISET